MEEVLLVGNPNTGKTTLFNLITKSDEKTGNWHGVTVEEKKKQYSFSGKDFLLVDLPGIYSLEYFSLEEKVAIDYLISHKKQKVVNICDVNNLERNLYLTLCLIECGFDVVLAINLTSKRKQRHLSCKKLSEKLGVSVVLVNAKSGEGKQKLLEEISKKREVCKSSKKNKSIEEEAEEKYEKISKILQECSEKTDQTYGKSKLDKFFLNRFFAPIIFFAIMGLIFYLTFFLIGKPISNFLNENLALLGRPVTNKLKVLFGENFWLVYLFEEAILGGIGTILSFLPQIILLFFFLSLLEESGYISRVAFVFDDLLSKVGLSGKSIYSLLLGFGCSGTAVMTTRNLENKKMRIKTSFAIPFLSCSARLPIFLAICGAVFQTKSVFVVIGLYALGLIVAVLVSFFMNKTILRNDENNFILEFPPYRMISIKKTFKVLWQNTKNFVIRVGSVLLALNVVVWIFSNFSLKFSFVKFGGESILETFARMISPIFCPLGFSSWGLVVALLVGVVAKEGVLSVIMLFASGNLSDALFACGSDIYFSSISGIVSFLVFCLLYVPCLSTIAIMRKEIGGKWTAFSVCLQFLVAYVIAMVSFCVCKLVEIFSLAKVVCFLLFAVLFCCSFFVIVRVIKKKNCKNCAFCRRYCKERKNKKN